jgi:hypothetical protein
MATLAELTKPTTEDEELAALLADCAARNLPVTSWQEGDVARTILQVDAKALAEKTTLRASIAASTLLRAALAAGLTDWIRLRAKEAYALDYIAAVATKGTLRLTASADAGPFTIAPGQLWATSTGGLRYQSANAAQATLPKGGTLDLSFQAESPGAAYNVANGTITSLLTPLPGVTVSNPDPGGGTWITTQGRDDETNESLVARCEARWPESGYGSPAASYDLWAKTADPSITRTKVAASGTVAGRTDVYVAGTAGPAGAGAVSAAQAYITPRAPFPSTAVVAAATAAATTVTATLYGKAQYETAALAAAQTGLAALFAATPIGGKIYRAALFEALMWPEGVENVVLAAPAADVVLTAAQVATLTANLTWSST